MRNLPAARIGAAHVSQSLLADGCRSAIEEHGIVGETALTRQVDGRGARRRAIPDLDGP